MPSPPTETDPFVSTPTRNPTPSDPSTPGTTSRKAKTIVWVVLAAVVLTGLIVSDKGEKTVVVNVERKVKHPGIVAITEGARRELFNWPAP